jgi:hypothetical protein
VSELGWLIVAIVALVGFGAIWIAREVWLQRRRRRRR